MKITNDHIKLLQAIKNECCKHEDCGTCIFYQEGNKTLCILDNLSPIDGIPSEWDLKESIENE